MRGLPEGSLLLTAEPGWSPASQRPSQAFCPGVQDLADTWVKDLGTGWQHTVLKSQISLVQNLGQGSNLRASVSSSVYWMVLGEG